MHYGTTRTQTPTCDTIAVSHDSQICITKEETNTLSYVRMPYMQEAL
jgi:hypothetical protein